MTDFFTENLKITQKYYSRLIYNTITPLIQPNFTAVKEELYPKPNFSMFLHYLKNYQHCFEK